MAKCYICGKKAPYVCDRCEKDICNTHTNKWTDNINVFVHCPRCYRIVKRKRLRIILLVFCLCFIPLAVGIALFAIYMQGQLGF